MKYLLVEDNVELARAICSRMSIDGHLVDHASLISEAMEYASVGEYDLILLDIMLPDGDGRTFLRHHRAGKNDTPVIVLTARSQVSDRISMLDLGADDYVTKPFDHAELQARCRAVLRRNAGSAQSVIRMGEHKLVDRLFSYDDDVSENAVEVYIGRLRKHLDGSDVQIKTLRGLGYRLDYDG